MEKIRKLIIGTKIRPKEHIRDWEDEVGEVDKIDSKCGIHIVIDENFGCWYTTEEILLEDYRG